MFGGNFFSAFGGMGMEEESAAEVDNKQLYDLLELAPTATVDEVKKQFRRMAMKYHPDKGGDADKFKEINTAYEVLSDPEKRRIYDKHGLEGLRQGGGSEMDIFDIFFGGGRGGARRRETPQLKPTVRRLDVSLDAVFAGKMFVVETTRKVLCGGCQGRGGSKVEKCAKCRGKGTVNRMMQIGPGMYTQSQGHCDACAGSGERIDKANVCKSCRGNKLESRKESVEVVLPPGAPEGHKVVVRGKGDEHPEYRAGDFVAVVHVQPHAVFVRSGNDLFTAKKIALVEALGGFRFNLRHFEGEVTVDAAAGVNNREVRVVAGLGMPHFKDPMSHGNLYVEFTVELPAALDRERLAALRALLPPPLLPETHAAAHRHKLGEAVSLPQHRPGAPAEEEDEEERGFRGGHRAQCQQQ